MWLTGQDCIAMYNVLQPCQKPISAMLSPESKIYTKLCLGSRYSPVRLNSHYPTSPYHSVYYYLHYSTSPYQPRSQDCKNRGALYVLGGGAPAETFSNRSLHYSNLIIAHIQAKTSNWGADCPRIGRVDGVEN